MKRVQPKVFKNAVYERVRAARIAAGLSHEDVAYALSMSLDAVKRWESRSLIPHDKIIPFCQITNISPDVLLAIPGKQEKPELTVV